MRKIEKEITNHFKHWVRGALEGRCFSSRVNEVRMTKGLFEYRLWGHDIFRGKKEGDRLICHFTNRGFFTKTTKSRLNAFLTALHGMGLLEEPLSIRQRSFRWFLFENGKPVRELPQDQASFTLSINNQDGELSIEVDVPSN